MPAHHQPGKLEASHQNGPRCVVSNALVREKGEPGICLCTMGGGGAKEPWYNLAIPHASLLFSLLRQPLVRGRSSFGD